MQTIKLAQRLPLLISFVTFSTVAYFCIFQQITRNANVIAVGRRLQAIESIVNRTGPVLSDIIDKSLDSSVNLQNMTNTNDKLSNERTFDIHNQLQQIKDARLNISLTLSDLPVFVSLIEKIVSETRKNRPVSEETRTPTSLLTLFTTWSGNSTNYAVHNATLTNWASFKSVVNPVVFSDNSRILRDAKKFGWEGHNYTKVSANGLPILKYMFMEAVETYDSLFYGYANADILFTGSLIKTLTSLQYSDTFRTVKHILISGVRTNLLDFSSVDIHKRSDISRAAREKGSLFISSSADYFITDKSFPWGDIPEVVIGAIAYDNWLIANARNHLFTTIDTTKSLLAIHLSQNDNHWASHEKTSATYNKDLLAKLFGVVNYYKGYTDCMQLFTELQNDTVVLRRRTQFAYYC